MSVDEVLEAVDRFGCPLVEITGGEPLLQRGRVSAHVRPARAWQDRDARNRRPPKHRRRASRGRPDHGCQVSGIGRSGEEPLGESRPADSGRPGQVRPRRIAPITSSPGTSSSGSRCRSASPRVLFSPVHGVLILARWPNGSWPIGFGAAPAAGPQVHLGAGHPRASDAGRRVHAAAVVLLSGGLDSYTAAAVARRTASSSTRSPSATDSVMGARSLRRVRSPRRLASRGTSNWTSSSRSSAVPP